MLRLLSIADFISITNAVLGVLAIIVLFIDIIDSLELRIHISISLILIALLADGLDGIVARRFGKSIIGDYLESMADMTSMVVAPAVFIFFVYSDVLFSEILRNIWLFVAVGLFLFFGIVRLGSFNIMKEKNRYVGLPASASAIILVILCYLRVNFLFILPTVIIMGALIASDFVFPKTDRDLLRGLPTRHSRERDRSCRRPARHLSGGPSPWLGGTASNLSPRRLASHGR